MARLGNPYLWALVLALIQVVSSAESQIKIRYQSLGSSSATPLATVDYDVSTLRSKLISWTPPLLDNLKSSNSEPISAPLVRILLPDGSATLTSLATFNTTLNQTLDLWLSPSGDGSIFSAAVSASAPLTLKELKEKARAERQAKRSPKSKKALKVQEAKSPYENVKINLTPPTNGPTPKLVSRKAPAINAEGQEVTEEEPEKSFFQKYWWIFLIGAIFAMSGGGGGDK